MKPGPPPKRAAERRRRNEPSTPVTEVDVVATAEALEGADDPDSLPFKVKQPIVVPSYDGVWADDNGQVLAASGAPDPRDGWHPLARDLWDSYSRSGQALFWQPTDWSIAALLCESITRAMQPQIIGYEERGDGETTTKTPIWGYAPIKGSDLSAMMKVAGGLGLLEGDRRRIGLELTSRYASVTPKAPPSAEDVAANRRGLFAVQ